MGPYGKDKETDELIELIFSWLSMTRLAEWLVGVYARERQRRRQRRADDGHTPALI